MEMIKKEWHAIFKNKILLISFIVISFIPILYASFFLKSVWDPYGKTGNLPVAVVNEDKEVKYNGETLNVGAELVDQLKEDENLNWEFVSAKEAQNGLKNQKYYMIVTIPEDFSANAATVMDDNPKKMNIRYETNGALNYLGEVIGETAMKQLKSEVSQKVTEVYANAIFDQLSEIGDGFEEAADGAKQLDDGAGDLVEGSQKLADGLDTLASSTITFSDGEETFSVALNQYLEGTEKLDDGLGELKAGVDTLGAKVPALADGVSQLDSGSAKLATGIKDYTGGVSKLAEGTGTLASNGTTLKTGVDTLVTGLNDGTAQLQSGAGKISAGLTQMSEKLGTQISSSAGQLVAVNKGIGDLNNSIQGLNAKLNAAGSFSVDPATLSVSVGDTSSIINAAQAARTSANDISGNISSLTSDIENSISGSDLDDETKAKVLGIIAEAKANSSAISNISNSVASITSNMYAVESGVSSIETNAGSLSTQVSTLAAAASSTNDVAAAVAQIAQGAAQVLPGAQEAIGSLSGGLSDVKSALDNQFIPGMNQLTGGISNLQSGLATGSAQLNAGLNTYIDGVRQVNNGVQELKSNSDALNSGASSLKDGLGKLNGNVPALQEGVNALVSGTNTIKEGSTELVKNNNDLMEGQTKLQDASSKLTEGAAELEDGGITLKDGLNVFKDGSGELASALSEGSEKINDVQTTDKTAKMIAEPNELTQEKYSEVPNYGFALAPYVLSLALYVGCLVFNFIYPIRKIAIKEKPVFQWWLSKITVGLVAATAMALIEGVVMMLIGLSPDHVLEYFIVALVSAYAYMFLIMFLAMAFDNPGRFVAMVLLILQLAGSGGTFPMPLTDKFFQDIHPYLPMTHSIYGFRQTISSGLGEITFTHNALLMVCIAIISQLLLLISMKLLKKFHRDGISQLDDNQKLLDDNYSYS
ncbi:MAG: YhgE/Pip domain-containing protein [Clostridiales bacterium]|nr:YhgE/Pip domain-containing protein [Clostridiales bacterium]